MGERGLLSRMGIPHAIGRAPTNVTANTMQGHGRDGIKNQINIKVRCRRVWCSQIHCLTTNPKVYQSTMTRIRQFRDYSRLCPNINIYIVVYIEGSWEEAAV